MKKSKHLLAVWLLTLAASFLGITAFRDLIGHDVDFFFMYKTMRGEPSGKVAIVKIDNASLDRFGRTDLRVLNFSKSVFADLVEKLESARAASVSLDVVFANRSEDEAALARTLRKYPNVVIAARLGIGGGDRVLPSPVFSGATWGMVDVLSDKNVVSKFLPFSRAVTDRDVEAFAIAAYRATVGDRSPVGRFANGAYGVNPVLKIPVEDNTSALVPFFRKSGEYPAYSLTDVLDGHVPASAFKGKAVLVGEYGTLIHDEHYAPISLGVPMPGVEFHANVLDGLLTGKLLRSLDPGANAVTAAGIALVSSAVFLFASVPVSVGYAFLFLFGLLAAGSFAMDPFGVLLPFFAYSVAGCFAAFPVAFAYRYFVVDRDRRFLGKAFGTYVDPEVVQALAERPELLRLGGEKREITVFFSDVAGFTGISESLGADRLFALVGEYLSQMTDVLLRNKGTLDKYVGDAVMGLFGAPLPVDDPEIRACRTAVEQQRRLEELRTKWDSEGYPEIRARIGIHCGEAMVGNVGSRSRFNYTAMGDTVNLASRLEGANKEYGTAVCVSESVAARAASAFEFRELDTIRVKGRTGGVRIFELLGPKGTATVPRETLDAYSRALEAYRSGDYSSALGKFASFPDDPPSAAMADRCRAILQGEVRLDGNAYVAESK